MVSIGQIWKYKSLLYQQIKLVLFHLNYIQELYNQKDLSFDNLIKRTNILTLYLNNDKELTTEQQKNKIFDYIFICFFLGNDFLPKNHWYSIHEGGIETFLKSYFHALQEFRVLILFAWAFRLGY